MCKLIGFFFLLFLFLLFSDMNDFIEHVFSWYHSFFILMLFREYKLCQIKESEPDCWKVIRPKKCVSDFLLTVRKNLGSVGKSFYFLSNFYLLEKDQKCWLGLKSSTVLENIQIMKLRTSRKLKNIILSIIFASLTFFKLFVQFSETWQGWSVWISFFWKAIKIAGSVPKKQNGSV